MWVFRLGCLFLRRCLASCRVFFSVSLFLSLLLVLLSLSLSLSVYLSWRRWSGAGLVLVLFVVCAAAVLPLLLVVLSVCPFFFFAGPPAGCLPGAADPDACRACGPAADCRICFLWFHIVQCKEWLPPKIAKIAVFRRIGSHVINVSTEKKARCTGLKMQINIMCKMVPLYIVRYINMHKKHS